MPRRANAFRLGGSLALLWGVSSSVVAVMAWQAAVALLTAVALLIALWAQLPSTGRRPRFQFSLLRDTGKFASSLGGMAVLGTVVLQADKTIVGALLPFAVVGHYMLASVIGQPTAAAASSGPVRPIAMHNSHGMAASALRMAPITR